MLELFYFAWNIDQTYIELFNIFKKSKFEMCVKYTPSSVFIVQFGFQFCFVVFFVTDKLQV